MSLLNDALFSGASARLHNGGRLPKPGHKTLRKSRSHGSFLSPLYHLVRNPVEALGGAVGSYTVPDADAAAAEGNRRQILYLRLKDAETYSEWKAAATELDALEGNEAWKEHDESPEYDAALVAARLQELDDARLSCDVTRMIFLIRTSLTRGLGDMGDLRLYKHSHVGTKKLIERYITSAQQTMATLLDITAKQGDQCPIEPQQLIQELVRARQSFGRSALLLSGGGTFGMNHIGVIKSLWEQHLLPRIISGASAGSIVCAVLCTKTDEEIPDVLHEFCHGDLNVFGDPLEKESLLTKAARIFHDRSFFDISHLRRVMRGILGDLTFREAYYRTRRILNIPVSTSSLYELPRLLNYATAPNVMIWSAVCASCSVPFVYNSASLLAKDPNTGMEVPWDPNPDATWIDGSVDNDLPMTRLAEMFNVNHFIVSQVNPHVVPFLAKEEEIMASEAHHETSHTANPSWMSVAVGLAREEILHRLQELSEIGFLPNLMTKARSILSQRYSGDINIFPKISYADFPRILSNPTPEYMARCLLTGQQATWPKLSRIQNHVAIELALDDTIHKMRVRTVFAPSQVDRPRDQYGRPISQGNENLRAQVISRRKSTHFAKPNTVLQKSAPDSPLLSRAALNAPSQFTVRPVHKANHSKIRDPAYRTSEPLLADLASSSYDTSDRDYFADPDSDTTDVLSSPSPPTTPTIQSPSPGPAIPQTRLLPTSSLATPNVTTAIDRRTGTLLNLTMTSAGSHEPSAAELQYKRLFHPSGPATPDPNANFSLVGYMDGPSTTPSSEPRPSNSRRNSGQGVTLGLASDYSGTKGILIRKLSSNRIAIENAPDEEDS